MQIDIRKLLPLVRPGVGSALVGGGGPAASHGIICPHCTQETQATIVQCVRSMTSCLLDAVGKNGNVFFLNENASKFVPVGTVCNFPAVVQCSALSTQDCQLWSLNSPPFDG